MSLGITSANFGNMVKKPAMASKNASRQQRAAAGDISDFYPFIYLVYQNIYLCTVE